jgi:hypothetical protein
MKVYVALGSFDYEGLAEPLGIFTTLALATECGEKNAKSYDGVGVMEYELDGALAAGKVVKVIQ